MRKITSDAVGAFLAGRPFNSSNTTVAVDGETVSLVLHGNPIAKREGGKLSVRTAGWPTVTTKERLNGLPGVSVYTVKHVIHLNGVAWDNDEDWTEVCSA